MKRSGLRIASGLLAALSFCGLLLFASCSSSEETARAVGDSPLGSARDSSDTASDTPAEERGSIVTGPTGNVRNREVGLTVGERLKRLDSLMQVVPPDSLGILMAEYERLLDSAMGGPGSPTPPNTQSSTPISARSVQQSEKPKADPSYPRSTPRSSMNRGADERVLVQSDYAAKPDSAFDPMEYSGLRESERDYYQESTAPSTTSTPPAVADAVDVGEQIVSTTSTTSSGSSARTTAVNPTSGEKRTAKPATGKKAKAAKKSRTRKGKKRREAQVAAAPTTTSSTPATSEPKPTRSSSLDENYTEGLAHFRAGRYAQAITSLKPVANSSSSSFRTTARYYYALSLERTGSLAQAASQFRSLSKGSGSLADKGWLGYCRVLKAQGKSGEAKKELLRLIKQRPGSSQVANARQMLQKL